MMSGKTELVTNNDNELVNEVVTASVTPRANISEIDNSVT